MQYDWLSWYYEMYDLYVIQDKTLPFVVEHFRKKGFTPSARAFQVQFRKWEFPPKKVPVDFRTPELVERVRQLWEANENQAAMLAALSADGFSITERQLRRVRTENQMLFKTRGSSINETNMQSEDLQRQSPEATEAPVEAAQVSTEVDVPNLLDDEAAFAQALQVESAASPGTQPSLAEEIYAGTLSHLQRANWADDHLPELDVPDVQTSANGPTSTSEPRAERKAQRNNTIDLTTGVQPSRRYIPSMEDCKDAIDVDDDAYWNIRDCFRGICIEMGLYEKKYATDLWNVAIARLIEENVHLHGLRSVEVGPSNDDAVKHRLQLAALDKICIAVAKGMRGGGPRVHPSDAKTILGLNRSTTDEIMQSFQSFLKQEYLLTSKSELKDDQRKDLINRWINSSPLLQGLLYSINPDPTQAQGEQDEKLRALERLCRDMLKKLRAAATKRVKNDARLRASPSSITDDAQGSQPRRRSTRRRTRINSQTPSAASLTSYSTEDISLLEDLNSLSPHDMNFFTPEGSTAFDSRHASPFATSDLDSLSTTNLQLDISPAVPDDDNVIDDNWYKSLQDQMNLDIEEHAAADELSLSTAMQGQDASHIMDDSCFDNLPDELNLDFPELVAPAVKIPAEMEEPDFTDNVNETRHNSLPEELTFDLSELATPKFDVVPDLEDHDTNYDMDGAWYSSLQEQLHDNLQQSSGNGKVSAEAQKHGSDQEIVPGQSIAPVDDLNVC